MFAKPYNLTDVSQIVWLIFDNPNKMSVHVHLSSHKDQVLSGPRDHMRH